MEPPASLVAIEPDSQGKIRRTTTTYWAPDFSRRDDRADWTERDWEDAVLAALRVAVERRLVADVPVGCLLSGGVDSSLIVDLLAEAGQHGLATFSIGFESVGGVAGDEFGYSDIIADRFATDHHQIRIGTDRMLPALDGAIGAMSEPMVSHDCVAFYLLSLEVAKHVKVVQSGQGADEVFAGYHWYPPMGEPDAASLDRPKGYFPVPALTHLEGPYLDLVRDALYAPAAKERGLFRPEAVDRLLADPNGRLTPLRGNELWQIALLELWLQRQGIAGAAA